jgi:hypothetical protein
MNKMRLLFLRSASDELKHRIDTSGPLRCCTTPLIEIGRPPTIPGSAPEWMIRPDDRKELMSYLAIKSEYDPTDSAAEDVKSKIDNVAIALQLVKPTVNFLEYWLTLDSTGDPRLCSRKIHLIKATPPDPYLSYQQHNVITIADVERATKLLPELSEAMRRHNSWAHPYSSVHRALIFFCQGYSIRLPELQQVLWAFGLDCLFTSKRKRGSQTIHERLRTLFGATFCPYKDDSVVVPGHQKRPNHSLSEIGRDVFYLRNAFVHGVPIPEAWLTKPGSPAETGYAYRLLECTEILLRLTLLKILEDPTLMTVFRDKARLDKYF